MTDAPYGLRPIRNMAGGNAGQRARVYRVTATGNTHGIFVGDPIKFNALGLGISRQSSNAVPTQRMLGVATEMWDENGRPLTFSQPTRGPFLPAGVAGWAAVVDSQMVTFICQADASAAETMVGQYVSLTAVTQGGNTASGQSIIQIKASSADTSVKFLQVIGISPTEQKGLGSFALNSGWGNAGIDLEVRIALHAFTCS